METVGTTPEIASQTLLRHTLATLAYRASKVLNGAPDGFESLRVADSTRPACDILAHLGDLIDWAISTVKGEMVWDPQPARAWSEGTARFFDALTLFDACLATHTVDGVTQGRLFQGPIADALTHVGQLATLRRIANAPVPGENYYAAEVVVGRTGAEQAPARRPF